MTRLALIAAAPVAAKTFTGQNGGTVVGIRICDRGQPTCTTNSSVTARNGATGTRSRVTTGTNGQITSTLTGMRLNGRSFGRTTTVTR